MLLPDLRHWERAEVIPVGSIERHPPVAMVLRFWRIARMTHARVNADLMSYGEAFAYCLGCCFQLNGMTLHYPVSGVDADRKLSRFLV